MKKSHDIIPDCKDCENKSVFCCLSTEEKEVLSERKGSNFFQKGQVIFYEGNHPHGLYCLYKGQVKISKLGEEGKDQIVRFATAGELLGYRAILSGEPYKATATALDDCYICHLTKDNFFKSVETNKSLSKGIIQLLTEDLKEAEQKLINISQKPVRERIAETLLLLDQKFGSDANGNLNVFLTRREIGDVAGITTETVIRTLSEFGKDRLIRLDGKKIGLLNKPKLILVANIHD